MSVIVSYLRGSALSLPLNLLRQRPQTFFESCTLRNLGNDGKPGPDYYAVLGITRAAEPQQVKMAYFQKAKKYHPDANPTKEAKWMFDLVAEGDILHD